MNFRRTLGYTVISCLLIVTVLFILLSIVDKGAQEASAQFRLEYSNENEVALKIKTSHQIINAETPGNEAVKGGIRSKLKTKLEDLNMRVVPEKDPNNPFLSPTSWSIYCLIRTHDPVFSMSITLTRRDTFVMNHLIIVDALGPGYTPEEVKAQNLAIDKSLALVLKVLQQKMENTDAHIVDTDDSTIVVN